MKVKNITLVITDPCYVKNTFSARAFINESTIYGDWSCMCYKGDKEEAKKKSEEWDEIYFNFFKTYNFTGLDDSEKKDLWEKFSAKKKEFIEANCYGEFCADSGRVAVYDYDELDEKDQKWIKEHDWCACVIPDYTGEFHYAVEGEGDNRSAHIVGDGFYTTQSGF
jgi:hypothetical protein